MVKEAGGWCIAMILLGVLTVLLFDQGRKYEHNTMNVGVYDAQTDYYRTQADLNRRALDTTKAQEDFYQTQADLNRENLKRCQQPTIIPGPAAYVPAPVKPPKVEPRPTPAKPREKSRIVPPTGPTPLPSPVDEDALEGGEV